MIGDILQPTHLLFVLVIALLVLGPKRLPEVGRALGRGIRDFRNAMSGDDVRDALTVSTDEAPRAPAEAGVPAEAAAPAAPAEPAAPAAAPVGADEAPTSATAPVGATPGDGESVSGDAPAPPAEPETEPIKQNVA